MLSGLLKGLVTGFFHSAGARIFIPGPPSSTNEPPYRHPKDRGIEYENIYLDTTENAKIHIWYMGHAAEAKDTRPTILYLHGQKGNMGDSLDRLQNFYEAGSNVVALDYRGYGESVGEPSESGVLNDAKLALDYVRGRPDTDPSKVFLYGHSLGGAIAISTAAENSEKLAGCMLENTFHDLIRLATEMYPEFRWVQSFASLIDPPFDSAKKIRTFRIPTLFISGLKDDLIHPRHMARLLEDCSSMMKWCLLVEDGDHGDTALLNPSEFQKAVTDFMNAAVSPASEPQRTVVIASSDCGVVVLPDPKLDILASGRNLEFQTLPFKPEIVAV